LQLASFVTRFRPGMLSYSKMTIEFGSVPPTGSQFTQKKTRHRTAMLVTLGILPYKQGTGHHDSTDVAISSRAAGGLSAVITPIGF
jgi:hypothetical protein